MDQALPRLLEVFYRRRWPAAVAFLSVMGGVALYLILAPRLYKAKVRMLLDERPAASISALGRDIATQPGRGDKSLSTQEELATSTQVLTQSLEKYRSQWGQTDPPLTLGEIKPNLKIITVPGTQILELSYESENPELSANLLNLIAQQVVEENIESIRAEAQATRKFLEIQVPQRTRQLAKAEAAISQFKRTHGILSLGELDSKRLADSIGQAENQIQALAAQLRQLQSRSDSLRALTNAGEVSETYSSIRTGQDQELKNLRAQLADLDAQIAAKRQSLSENHPEIQTLVEEQRAIQVLYDQKLQTLANNTGAENPETIATDAVSQDLSERYILVEVERQEIAEKLAATRAHLAQLNERREKFPVLEQLFAKLTRRQQSVAGALKLLQGKLEEAKVAEAQLLSNLKIIETAKVPGNPASPQFLVTLVLGTVAGLLQALGIVLLLEGLDKTIHNESEIEQLVDFPVISVLPILPKKVLQQELSATLSSDSAIVEAFRSLLRRIEFRSEGSCLRLVVASAISGEGKSLVASQLAAIAARYSRKTLLIDTDFERPSQHQIFKLSMKPGLQDCLLEEGKLSQAIQKTSIENLSVMTVGSFHENPAEFFESGAISAFISEMSHNYELVIIDTSAVISSINAATLGDISNSFLMVARANVTPKLALQNAVSKLVGNGIQILGVAFNGSKSQAA